MAPGRPHFLLLSDARSRPTREGSREGRWRFVLEATDGDLRMDVEDQEPHVDAERLELLTVVRGLEALDQPSRVTLVTPSRYVTRGIRFGLEAWRRHAWCWEHDGRMVPVNNQDLWRRLDQAFAFHDVHCRWLRVDEPHLPIDPAPNSSPAPAGDSCRSQQTPRRHAFRRLRALAAAWEIWLGRIVGWISPSPRQEWNACSPSSC